MTKEKLHTTEVLCSGPQLLSAEDKLAICIDRGTALVGWVLLAWLNPACDEAENYMVAKVTDNNLVLRGQSVADHVLSFA